MEIYRMKKSLFAIAATTAFAGAAQAQSSVTVYGILDMGYVGSNTKAVSATGITIKGNTSSFGQSQEQTSRLGFKGTEDLGGGTSAFFTAEFGLTPQNPNFAGGGTTDKDSLQGTTQNGGSAIDNRQTFVGLKKNGIGQFAFGRQYTPIFNAGAATDASQYANVVGNVIYQGSSISGTDGQSGVSAGSTNTAFTNRASNALTIASDKFAGFGVSGMYALNNANATQFASNAQSSASNSSAGGNTNWNGWGLSGDFAWQKLYLTVGYQSFKTQYSNATYLGGSYLNIGQGGTSGLQTSQVYLWQPSTTSDKQTYVGGTYDFGILKAYAQWVGRKVQQDNSFAFTTATGAGAQLNRTAQQIGVRSYITPTIEAWASVGNGKVTGAVATAANGSTAAGALPGAVNFFGYQLGGNYYLSKRTNLYAIYGQTQSTSSSSGVAGSGATSNQYTVGVRHTF
jgi:predicted porin